MAAVESKGGNGCAWTVAIGTVLFVLFLAWSAYLARTPEGQQQAAERDLRAQERDMIERCRDAQNDELEELSTRRLMRAACDRMEDEFRRKWSRAP